MTSAKATIEKNGFNQLREATNGGGLMILVGSYSMFMNLINGFAFLAKIFNTTQTVTVLVAYCLFIPGTIYLVGLTCYKSWRTRLSWALLSILMGLITGLLVNHIPR